MSINVLFSDKKYFRKVQKYTTFGTKLIQKWQKKWMSDFNILSGLKNSTQVSFYHFLLSQKGSLMATCLLHDDAKKGCRQTMLAYCKWQLELLILNTPMGLHSFEENSVNVSHPQESMDNFFFLPCLISCHIFDLFICLAEHFWSKNLWKMKNFWNGWSLESSWSDFNSAAVFSVSIFFLLSSAQ